MATREERREEAREEARQGIAAGCIACAMGTLHNASECAAARFHDDDGQPVNGTATPGCPGCEEGMDHDVCRLPGRAVWRDNHGDLWWEADDDLLHGGEVNPFARAYIEKKWGPLTPVLP